MKDKKIAIFEVCGKQYLAGEGDIVTIENFNEDLEVGAEYTAPNVLLTFAGGKTEIGAPYLRGVSVKCVVDKVGRLKKVMSRKSKAKSRWATNKGHRQEYTKLKVVSL